MGGGINMGSHFFAMMARMKYIERWALMRNSDKENVSEHSLEVSMIAHALAVIGKVRFGSDLNEERVALLGLYHDSTEIITGDMPTPIKYLNSGMKGAFREVEEMAAEKLLDMLPEDLREYYEPFFHRQETDGKLWYLIKGADKLSALIKCIHERKTGNSEFLSAEESLRKTLKLMGLREVDVFMEELLPSYERTLDELNESFLAND
jgi:5'-deoxynucleotidase